MLTRFEKARIIGSRALQISLGAPVLVKVPKSMNKSADIVRLEFDEGVLPISVIRTMPNGDTTTHDINGSKIE